ncbi:MAG TPA: DNA repair exonuclease [Myxococcaceae bacterium]|nr:DNA repair exonuclease [Myxococcaceae bacterium]
MNFKFVHAADLHLDSPLRARTAGPLQGIFEDATFAALRRIVDLCLAEKAEFLLLAGDLFEYRDRSVRARLELRRQLGRLDAAGIRTFIVHGNHDPLCCEPKSLRLFDSVKVFSASWEEVELRRDGHLLCRIQGVSYPQERVAEDLTPLFSRQGPEFTIGLLHANVGGNPAHPNYAPCSLADLDARCLDYWALGHVHTRDEHRLPGGGVAVYPGNPQGRHIAETGERGCVLVEVKDGRAQPRFWPLESVRWSRLEVDIAPLPTIDSLADAICQKIADAACAGPDAHAVEVCLIGAGPLHYELGRLGALSELVEHLSPWALQRSPPVLFESIEDHTRSELDIRAATAPGTLGEAIASVGRSAAASAGALNQLCADEGLVKLHSALRRAGMEAPPAGQLLDRAILRALELLQSEGGP